MAQRCRPLRTGLLGLALALALPLAPARALEEVLVELPLLNTSLRVRLDELSSPEALLRGNSSLAELDRASRGQVGEALVALFHQRLPLSISRAAEASVGSPLLEQVLLLLSSFGSVEGVTPDVSGHTLERTLRRAMAEAPNGQPTLLEVMKAIPGQRARLNLSQAAVLLQRMLEQRTLADRLLARVPPAPAPTAASAAAPQGATADAAAAEPAAGGPSPPTPAAAAVGTPGQRQWPAGVEQLQLHQHLLQGPGGGEGQGQRQGQPQQAIAQRAATLGHGNKQRVTTAGRP